MADRRDIEDIKLSADDILDVEIKDEDLKNIGDLRDLDLGDELLDDDFSDPVLRPKKRKSLSITTLVLMLVLVVVGGGFILLNNESITRALTAMPSSEKPPVAEPETAEVVEAPPAADAAAPAVPPPSPSLSADDFGLPQPDLAGQGAPPVVAPAASSDVAPAPAPTANSSVPASPTPADGLPPPPSAETAVAPEFVAPDAPAVPAAPSDQVAVTPPLAVPPAPTPAPAPALEQTPPPSAPSPEVSAAPEPAAVAAAVEPPAPTVAAPLPEVKPPVSAPVPDVAELVPVPMPEPEQPQVTPSVAAMPPPVPAESDEAYLEDLEPVARIAKQSEPRLTMPPDPMDHNLGVVVHGAENPGSTAASSADANNPEARISLATRALGLERYQAAFDMFNDLYVTNKRDERVLMGRAVALQKLGRNEEAIKAYDELLALNPSSPEVMTNMLGLVRKQYPSAVLQRLLELRQRYPNNAVVAAQTGLANAGVGNFEEGLRYLGIAAGLEPTNPKHPFNMAVIAERMGKADLAVTYYEQALKADVLAEDPENKVNRDLIYDRLSLLRQRER